MGKKKVKAVDPGCDHEPLEVSRNAENKSTFWACPCGEKQYVSGPQTEGKLIELRGKDKVSARRL